MCTLGGAGAAAPMQFDLGDSGYLAFTPPGAPSSTTRSDGSSARPLLLVTDAGHDTVHVVDVVDRTHAGYLAAPGSIAGPRGVAATGAPESALVAVSAWKALYGGNHVVVVYRGSGAVWEAVRVIGGGAKLLQFGGPGPCDGQLSRPYGLRFSGDGSGICVADSGAGRASVFRVDNGGFVRHVATVVGYPMDVEEVEGGWLAASMSTHSVVFVGDGVGGVGGGRPSLGKAGGGDGEFRYPSALAVVPGLGLVVRDYGRLQVFATPDAIAMASMSSLRVAWMGAVARSLPRHHVSGFGSLKKLRELAT